MGWVLSFNLFDKKSLIEPIVTRVLNQLGIGFISSSRNVDDLVWKHILDPATLVETLIVQTKFYLPHGSFIFSSCRLASQRKTVVIKILVRFLILLYPVVKLITWVRVVNLLWIKKLTLFPVPEIQHHFSFFPCKYKSRHSMHYLKFLLLYLLNLKYLINIILVNFTKFSMFLSILLVLSVDEGLIVFFTDENKIMVAFHVS